jgi:hypothetical protein
MLPNPEVAANIMEVRKIDRLIKFMFFELSRQHTPSTEAAPAVICDIHSLASSEVL